MQQRFYNMIKQQMVDFDEIFHKDFIIEKISKIPDQSLKYLLEEINLDKDKITKKGYITYAKFAHYALKFIENIAQQNLLPQLSYIDTLLKKRELLIKTIDEQNLTIEEKNKLIKNLASKKLMFKQDNKNILNKIDYYIIERYGFYRFFDESNNYNIKDILTKYYIEYNINNTKKLIAT